MKKFEEFVEKFNYLFTFPLLILFLFVSWYNGVNNEDLKVALSLIISIGFITYLVICAIKLGNTFVKTEILWPFIVSFVLLIMSWVMSFADNGDLSGIISIIGILFFELFALYIVIYSCFSKDTNINRVLIFSSIFVVLGYVTIYKSTYNVDNNDLFNSLISIFSAVIGGGITLAGVAWTIKHEREEKRKDEVEKAKPYFTFNMLYDEPKNIKGLKICIPENLDLNYFCDTYAEIENSNQSVVILNKIYHDGKWGNLEANNMLVHGGKLLLNFQFDNPNNIILEVKDVFGNLYYYILNVLHTTIISGSKIGVHTVRSIKEISKEDLNKILQNGKKPTN